MEEMITYGQYQKLSDADKAKYDTHWNGDGKSGYATLKGYKAPEVKSNIPTYSMGPASPDTKTVLTREEAQKAGVKVNSLPTQWELEHPILSGSRATDANGWIDSDNNVHLNSRATEARAKAAEEDRIEGRDYRTAKAPSQRELDMRNGTFNAKTYENNYVWSDQDLIDERARARASGDTELERKLQEEINRRDAEGGEHAWSAADRQLAAARAEAAKPKEEAPATEPEPETDTKNFQVGESQEDSEFIGGNEPAKETKTRKNDYWTNFMYGNGWGSVKDNAEAQAEKEKNQDEFLKSNPSLIKAIFGKNSGLNFGERVARLGELLSMMTADATRGAYAGFNHQALPEATKGKYDEIYKKALENQYERKQDVFESENKAKIDKANRLSILKSSPILSRLDDTFLDQLADKAVTGVTDAEWATYSNDLAKKGYTQTEIDEIKSTFSALRNTFSDITTQRGNVVELNGKEFDLMRKPQQAIAELQAQRTKLQEQLVQARTLKYEQLTSFMQSFKSTYAGIQNVSASMTDAKEFGYNASAEVKGGIPVVHGSVSGGVNGGNSSSATSGTQTDQLALEGLAMGKTTAAEWNRDTATYRKALEASIQAAIDEIDSQIAALKKFHSIDDGIVKAPHMKQWLVREDGSRIALNPNDSIYATKNKLTTKKDDKSDVVPMEKEDKVVVIQKKLGHCNGKRIEKKTDYYLSKLK